ncbi:MAG: hypothetical protein AAGC66_00350 [Leifsonia sp.]
MRSRRSKIAALFFTAGLTAALVVTGATAAQAATLVGNDVHVAEYCTWKHGADSFAFNINNSWNGWRCSEMSVVYSVDMNQACSHYYGSGVYALDPTSTWNGWHCYR